MPLIKPLRGTQLNRTHPLARGLVRAWIMNENGGTLIYDRCARIAANFSGAPTWAAGKYGSRIECDGTDDSIDNTAILPITSYPFTIIVSAVRCSGSYSNWYGVYQSGVSLQRAAIYCSSTGFLTGIVQSGSSGGLSSTTSFAIGDEYWGAFVGYSSSNRSMFVNGRFEANTTAGKNFPASPNTESFARTWDGASPSYYAAKFNFVYAYNRALTDAEIAWLYREPFAMFEQVSGIGLLYTLPAGIWLAGSAEAQSATSAAVKQLRRIAGSVSAQSQGSALCKITRKVSGIAASASDVTGLLKATWRITASVGDASAADGTLTLSARLPWFTGSPEIERQWLREVLFNCVSANAFKLGTVLTAGWFWVRVSGCCALYRGADMDRVDFTNILAVAAQDAREIRPPGYLLHSSNSTYFYVVRRFNNCGYRECTLIAAVEVSINASGELAKPHPNNIFDSKATQTDGNKIHLVWFYCPLEQKSKPERFKIYWDGRTGQIDYENPIATINYQGRKYYDYETISPEAGRYLFAIRAEDANSTEDNSLAQSKIDVHTGSPDSITILSAETI
jgi:hypothetical protein